jgi:glycine hydroxymethyltransferase
VPAPIDINGYSLDLSALQDVARDVKPKLITIGGSLNLFEHSVSEVRSIADKVGAKVLFDAAHQCGVIAGRAWKNPLNEGAHLMTMSTYKSLGGPAGGLLVTNEADLAERLDAIAFPGMTANFDAAKSAALAISLLDWRVHGHDYASAMITLAQTMADALSQRGIPVFRTSNGFTNSHQFAIEAAQFGGGQAVSKRLRDAGFLACGIGLPVEEVAGDMNGLRLGTPELVRWGVRPEHVPTLSGLITDGIQGDCKVTAAKVREMRSQFTRLQYVV